MWVVLGGGPWMIAPGETLRAWWDWDPTFDRGQHPWCVGFAIPPNILTVANRVVSFNHGLEQPEGLPGLDARYTVDLRGEDTLGTGDFGVFRLAVLA